MLNKFLSLILIGAFFCNVTMGSDVQVTTIEKPKEISETDDDFVAKYKKRKNMLKWHKYSAWTAVGLMGATLVTGSDGDGLHKGLGIASGAAYITSGALAYMAPKFDDQNESTSINIHKKLAFIHVPAFILAGYSGFLAAKQDEDDEELSGLAKQHGTFAALASISFGLAAFTSTEWSMRLFQQDKDGIACSFTKRF